MVLCWWCSWVCVCLIEIPLVECNRRSSCADDPEDDDANWLIVIMNAALEIHLVLATSTQSHHRKREWSNPSADFQDPSMIHADYAILSEQHDLQRIPIQTNPKERKEKTSYCILVSIPPHLILVCIIQPLWWSWCVIEWNQVNWLNGEKKKKRQLAFCISSKSEGGNPGARLADDVAGINYRHHQQQRRIRIRMIRWGHGKVFKMLASYVMEKEW